MQPSLPEEAQDVDYDSAGSNVSDLSDEDEEDVFDGDGKDCRINPNKDNTEHSNPNSYSWAVMRLAVLRIIQNQLQDFLNVAGIEIQGIKIIMSLTKVILFLVKKTQTFSCKFKYGLFKFWRWALYL